MRFMKLKKTGHILALFTIVFWGTTYISTKVLLVDFQPIEILLIRFLMGYLGLCVLCPTPAKKQSFSYELLLAMGGWSGITIYYLLENISLQYTTASNVGIIIAIAPCLTALLSRLFLKGQETLKPIFFLGFLIAMAGILLIHYNGTWMHLNPLGDFLAICASVAWAVYSIFSKKVGNLPMTTLQATRRIFLYGILAMIPGFIVMHGQLDPTLIVKPVNGLNLLFLGFGASALCFVLWNEAVKRIGAIQTSVYIYLTPVVTVTTSVLILSEPVTWMEVVGIVLTMVGLILSNK